MTANSKIGWTHHTMNFWWGCHKVSEECRHCYIGGIMRRGGYQPFQGPMRTKHWSAPHRWNKQAAKTGSRFRIFTCSMSDFFHPEADAWRGEAWDIIRDCEHLDWLILTKRPELALERLPSDWSEGYANVWLGVTAGCRASLSRLPILNSLPASVRFVSAEPLLESLDLSPYLGWVDWVITGCERAAKGKRKIMDLGWVQAINNQCSAANVPHFFKQAYVDDRGVPCETPLLDGQIVQQFPQTTSRNSSSADAQCTRAYRTDSCPW